MAPTNLTGKVFGNTAKVTPKGSRYGLDLDTLSATRSKDLDTLSATRSKDLDTLSATQSIAAPLQAQISIRLRLLNPTLDQRVEPYDGGRWSSQSRIETPSLQGVTFAVLRYLGCRMLRSPI